MNRCIGKQYEKSDCSFSKKFCIKNANKKSIHKVVVLLEGAMESPVSPASTPSNVAPPSEKEANNLSSSTKKVKTGGMERN